MPRTGGDITRAKILEVAEELFSTKGYDGTSIGEISKAAGINKATIYYHFKDKKDIIQSLFSEIIIELIEKLNINPEQSILPEEKIFKEMSFLKSKRRIITVMFMESLKSDSESNFLFRTMDEVIKKDIIDQFPERKELMENEREYFYVHEFFTGLMPVLTYIIFEDRWADYYEINKDNLPQLFMKAFKASHINSHFS